MSQVHVVGMSRANVALMCTYDPESLSEFHVVVRTARILGSIIRSILSASSFVMSLMRSTPFRSGMLLSLFLTVSPDVALCMFIAHSF
jgi:hypothetical protein